MPPATLLPSPAPGPDAGLEAHPAIDVVVPVFNEQRVLAASIRRLHASPRAAPSRSPGASSSPTTRAPTPPPASRAVLAAELPGVAVLRPRRSKGRGRALRAAWSASDARRRRLHGRRPLDRPATRCCRSSPRCSPATATSPSARGWRAARTSCAAPGARSSRAPTTDPAARVAARPLLRRPVRLQGRACRRRARAAPPTCATTAGSSTPSCWCSPSARGLRIHEVPVDWVDDPDSRVDIVRTALTDLRGVGAPAGAAAPSALPGGRRRLDARLRAALRAAARAARPDGRERRGAGGHRRRQHRGQPALHLRRPRPRRPVRQHARGAVVYALTLALTSGVAVRSCTAWTRTRRARSSSPCSSSPRSARR